jgi:hypothetical protein
MEEKKLTDDEIVKALEICSIEVEIHDLDDCKECPYFIKKIDCVTGKRSEKDFLDLINRQKAEIERLKIDLANEKNWGKIQKKQLQKQVDELKEERENMQAEIIGLESQKEDLYFQNQNLQAYIENHEEIWKRNAMIETAELQKQVDELKERAKIDLANERNWGKIQTKQAVKDRSKEILRTLIEKAYVNECIDLTVAEVKAWFREDYGVEV